MKVLTLGIDGGSWDIINMGVIGREKDNSHNHHDNQQIQWYKVALNPDSQYALLSLLHYAVALREGVKPGKLGLSADGEYAYLQCLDLGEPYTQGGTVIFRCRTE